MSYEWQQSVDDGIADWDLVEYHEAGAYHRLIAWLPAPHFDHVYFTRAVDDDHALDCTFTIEERKGLVLAQHVLGDK